MFNNGAQKLVSAANGYEVKRTDVKGFFDTPLGVYSHLEDYSEMLADPINAKLVPSPYGAHAGLCQVFRSVAEIEVAPSSSTGVGWMWGVPTAVTAVNNIVTSSTTSVINTVGNTASVGALTYAGGSQFPYGETQVGPQPSASTAGAGILAKNLIFEVTGVPTTPELYRGGRCWVGVSGHSNAVGLNPAQISVLVANNLATEVDPTKPFRFHWTQMLAADYLANNNSAGGPGVTQAHTPPSCNRFSNNTFDNMCNKLFVYWSSPSVSGSIQAQTWLFKITAVAEYTGSVLTGGLQPNSSTLVAGNSLGGHIIPALHEIAHRVRVASGAHIDAGKAMVAPAKSWIARALGTVGNAALSAGKWAFDHKKDILETIATVAAMRSGGGPAAGSGMAARQAALNAKIGTTVAKLSAPRLRALPAPKSARRPGK